LKRPGVSYGCGYSPVEDFYPLASHGQPAVDAKAWSFRIDGLVKNPLRFNYEEIRALPRYETTLALECIWNPVGGRVDIFGNPMPASVSGNRRIRRKGSKR
jgi:DMSO/TMAO reductase YedYZ molybdopterin-dependent catalytic subunit